MKGSGSSPNRTDISRTAILVAEAAHKRRRAKSTALHSVGDEPKERGVKTDRPTCRSKARSLSVAASISSADPPDFPVYCSS